ncbi:MAG: DUF4442 domain-containing protein [Pseudomonadota bacterium]
MPPILSKLLSHPRSQMLQFKALLNAYPPYVGAGIRTRHVSEDFSEIDMVLRLRWFNKNYFGTHFGGSLYAMTDPIYCLMLAKQLGRDYITWDKAANIEFVSPGRGEVRAEFRLTPERVEEVRRQAASGKPVFPEFEVRVLDERDKLVARVHKTLYVREKPPRR